MKKRKTGKYIICSTYSEPYKAFVPLSLPPEPPIQLDDSLFDLMEKANRALGRLDGITSLLPNTYLFTYFYVRKEAVLSSQIEGTQSSLSELLLFETEEIPGVPIDDVLEVSNYVKAMDYGLANIRNPQGLPISLRLIKEMHKVLLSDGRGSNQSPGEIRASQNWVGGSNPNNANFVGPPADKIQECLDELEKFIHNKNSRTPVLIKAALAHVQFETIHPFMDGNGRMGRLLITLLLCAEEALKEPMLYLSLYFKTNRLEYYERLQSVREKGEWEEWLKFFLIGVLETSQQAVDAANSILHLFDEDRNRIASVGRSANSALRVHEVLQRRPIISVYQLIKELKLSKVTVGTAVKQLEKLGVLKEITGKERFRLYVYQRYISILDEGTKPIEINT